MLLEEALKNKWNNDAAEAGEGRHVFQSTAEGSNDCAEQAKASIRPIKGHLEAERMTPKERKKLFCKLIAKAIIKSVSHNHHI